MSEKLRRVHELFASRALYRILIMQFQQRWIAGDPGLVRFYAAARSLLSANFKIG